MYDIIKTVILSKNYVLEDMLYKINKMWIESAITEEQKAELDNLARENANVENSYAPIQEQINQIFFILDSMDNRIKKLEGTEEPIGPAEEYPEYKQPTGAHNSYKNGDKVTYKGKKYICKMDNCVWSPDTYPQAWEEVKEEREN